MEVAGVALAVLPLLVGAAKQYNDCFRPIGRYCNLSSDIPRFQRRLKIQATIYHNTTRLLLESCLDHDVATRMIEDAMHPRWKDGDLDNSVAKQLDTSKDACLSALEEINSILNDLTKDSESLNKALKTDETSHSMPTAWLHRTGEKLKSTFSMPRLEKTLAQLRSLNEDFRTLSMQTASLEARSTGKRSSMQSGNVKQKMQRFKTIQDASRNVYEALGRSCTKHSEHFTHFCLDTTIDGAGEEQQTQVKFKIAFTHLAIQGSLPAGSPIFFVIESIVRNCPPEAFPHGKENALKLINSLKRGNDSSSSEVATKKTKRVQFADAVPEETSQFYMMAKAQEPMRNLCVNGNFCNQLRSYIQCLEVPHKCLGTLDENDYYQHFVYSTQPLVPKTSCSAGPTSLEAIMSIFSQDESSHLPEYERLRLARSLATAVLQYHATPWLPGLWRSDDIYFFDADEKLLIQDPSVSLPPPHLNVTIKGQDARSSPPPYPPPALAPNSLLFSLGVLLLEIAYMKPLRDLMKPIDHEMGQGLYAEFFAAKRLSQLVGRKMRPEYGKIVKKCLQCNFGEGDDLNDPALQAVYYTDVVSGLDELETGFRNFHLGSQIASNSITTF